MCSPVPAQHVERPGHERHEPVLVPLAASHVQQSRRAGIADLEIECLLQAESQGIHGPKETLHGRLADGVDELIARRPADPPRYADHGFVSVQHRTPDNTRIPHEG